MASPEYTFTIQTLDGSLWNGSAADRTRFAEGLRAGLAEHGFVKIVNHGIPDEQVAALFKWSKRFFQLPTEAKLKIGHPPGNTPQRGWSGVGSENAAKLFRALATTDLKIPLWDAKEHFDQGAPSDTLFPNQWPDEKECPEFRQFSEDFYKMCHEVSSQLLQALELAMNLPAGSFTNKHTLQESADELRMIRYPPLKMEDIKRGEVSRIWPHTDLGVISLLFQDDVGGLEIEDRSKPGTFQPVLREHWSEMVVNVSETMQRWTNNALKAGIHRVTTPAHLKHLQDDGDSIPERFSHPYFVKADFGASVGPLPEFINNEQPAAYENITALQYHMQRVAKAY